MVEYIAASAKLLRDVVTGLAALRRERSDAERDALMAVGSAANRTSAYLADLRDGHRVADRDEEVNISHAWETACGKAHAAGLRDLAEKCFVKAAGWSDPRLWNDPRFASVRVDLETITDACLQMLRQSRD